MRRSVTLATLALSALLASTAFAERAQSTNPGRVAKAAYEKQTGQKLAHTREIYSFGSQGNGYKTKVMGWNGATRGPGAKDAFMFVVPSGKDRKTMVGKTQMTGNIEKAGRNKVAAHLRAKGASFTSIRLGDHVTANRNELLQHPVSRESGYLRYTVTMKSGEKIRYLVPTSETKMVAGQQHILGKVFRDTDTYNQKTVR